MRRAAWFVLPLPIVFRRVKIGLVLSAGFAVWAGDELGLGVLEGLGGVLLGAAIGVWGVEALLKRRVDWADEDDDERIYRGTAAALLGGLLVLLGAGIVLGSVVLAAGAEESVFDFIERRPGIAFVTVGTLLGMVGTAKILGYEPSPGEGSFSFAAERIMSRIGGVLLVLLGVSLVGLGVWETLSPGSLERVFDRLVASILGPRGPLARCLTGR